MIYEKDWMMRQIESVIRFMMYLITGEKVSSLEVLGTDGMPYNELYSKLHKYILNREFKIGEEKLFDAIEADEEDAFNASVIFYFQLNRLGDRELEENEFSREAILEGIKRVCTVYGIPIDLVLRE